MRWRSEPNPVLVKELRSRFRGARAHVLLTLFLALLAGVAAAAYAYAASTAAASFPFGMPSATAASMGLSPFADIGRKLFTALVLVEGVLIALAAPALTMGAISGEVERQTYELLMAVPLSGGQIVRGKVGAAMAYILLLVCSALPIMSLAFVFGGVSATEVIMTQATVLAGGLLYATVGVFFSALFRRTARAAMFSYAVVGLLVLVPIVANAGPLLGMSAAQGSAPMAVLLCAGKALCAPLSRLGMIDLLSPERLLSGPAEPYEVLQWSVGMVNTIALTFTMYAVATARVRADEWRARQIASLSFAAMWFSGLVAAVLALLMNAVFGVNAASQGDICVTALFYAVPIVPGLIWAGAIRLMGYD